MCIILIQIQSLPNNPFAEKDPWLVGGLYDWHGHRGSSPRVLDILLRCADSEPHDRHLLDRICEGLKQGGKGR